MPKDNNTTRKLRAILSADVKGYSLLMADDEAFTIRTLKEYRSIMSEQIEQHNGRVVDAPGDNLLAEFSSAVDAVQCTVEIQKILKDRNNSLPNNKRLEFRIGVNIGDVVQDGDSIYGSGVNVAARIEGLAEPGGVCISRNAYDHIKDKLKLGYEYLGEHAVKNITEPVRVYRVLMEDEDAGKLVGVKAKSSAKRWVWPLAAAVVVLLGIVTWQFYQKKITPEFEPASVDKMAFPLPDKPSIAVLPFDNLSGDPGQEYFSDGIAVEIINGLVRWPAIVIIPRSSSFIYKGKTVDITHVGREMGVRYVLEGSVRREGNRVRVTVQLVDVTTLKHLFSERYEREMKDIFAIQDEITMGVLTAMRVSLSGIGVPSLRGKPTKSIEAYLKLLQAEDIFISMNRDTQARAKRLAEEAIALDPEYARAYALMAATIGNEVLLGVYENPQEALERAIELADKAIQLDDSENTVHRARGFLALLNKDYEKAIAGAKRAVELAPNSVMAQIVLGYFLYSAGRNEEAIPILEKAVASSPIPSPRALSHLGIVYRKAQRYEEAVAVCRKLIQIKPNYIYPHLNLAATFAEMDKMEEARTEIREVLRINPKYTVKLVPKSFPWKDRAELDLLSDSLRKAGLPAKPPLPLPDKPSIAVLAFDNMSGDSEQEYFSDGISEEIITSLSKTDKLFVIARNSTFTYKGKPVNVKQVAEELGVRYVLEGSVRKSEDRVRITAQLIDATAGHHLWAERYDRDLKDIFALQDEITMKIVTALRIKLTEGEQACMWAEKSKDLDVYLKQMEALSLWAKGTKESHIRHGQIGKEIVDMAPESAIGYRILSWYNWYHARVGKSPRESIAKAFKLAQKALSLDETDAFSHALLGNVYLLMRKYEKAIAAGERSIELQPNGAMVHGLLGMTLSYAGRLDEAIGYLNQGIRLNPFPAYWYFQILGRCYRQKGQYEKALTETKKALHRSPDALSNHLSLAVIYSLLDRQEEAEAAAKKVLEIDHSFSVERASKAWPYKNQADLQLVVDALRKAGLPE